VRPDIFDAGWVPALAELHTALGDVPGAITRNTVDVGEVSGWINEVIGTAPASQLRPLGAAAQPVRDRRRVLSTGALQVRSLELFDPDVHRLCDLLADAVNGRPVNCNLFVSLAGAEPGLTVHYDCLDVIVVGLYGSKTWHLWPADAHDPRTVIEDAFVDASSSTAPSQEMIRAGDLMAVQRGTPHMARVDGDQAAVHLAIGVASPPRRGRWKINGDGSVSEQDPSDICDHPFIGAGDLHRRLSDNCTAMRTDGRRDAMAASTDSRSGRRLTEDRRAATPRV
jgi:Cupin superfamily protein